MKSPATPALDQILAVRGESQVIGLFLEWLDQKGYLICVPRPDAGPGHQIPYYPAGKSTEQLLADYFEIDLAEAERERQRTLDYMRAARRE